jgi:uncharacterized protein YqgC (DUF456 family)
MNLWLEWALVFVLVASLDFVRARCTQYTTAGAAVRAGIDASLILLMGGFAVISYTRDPYLLIPAALGAFAGTYVAVLKRNQPSPGESAAPGTHG